MERKAKRNCALSVRCRYVARQIHRSPGRGLLALLVAAVLLFGLCYLQESIPIQPAGKWSGSTAP